MSHRILTIPEVAKILRVPKGRAYELVRENRLRCFRMGKQVRVLAPDLDAFIESGGFQLSGDQGRDPRSRAAS